MIEGSYAFSHIETRVSKKSTLKVYSHVENGDFITKIQTMNNKTIRRFKWNTLNEKSENHYWIVDDLRRLERMLDGYEKVYIEGDFFK